MRDNSIKLSWGEFQICTTSFLSKVKYSEDFSDVTLACDNEELLNAHRLILSAGSSFFESVLQKTGGQTNPLLYIRGVQIEQLKAVMDFLYLGVASVRKQQLDEFLALARDLGVRGLAEETQDMTAQHHCFSCELVIRAYRNREILIFMKI